MNIFLPIYFCVWKSCSKVLGVGYLHQRDQTPLGLWRYNVLSSKSVRYLTLLVTCGSAAVPTKGGNTGQAWNLPDGLHFLRMASMYEGFSTWSQHRGIASLTSPWSRNHNPKCPHSSDRECEWTKPGVRESVRKDRHYAKWSVRAPSSAPTTPI